MHHALCIQTNGMLSVPRNRVPRDTKPHISHCSSYCLFFLNLRKSSVLRGKSKEDQGRRKLHNSRGHKAFLVPQIPEGKMIFPANKFITTPVEPAQMQTHDGGSWRGDDGRGSY